MGSMTVPTKRRASATVANGLMKGTTTVDAVRVSRLPTVYRVDGHYSGGHIAVVFGDTRLMGGLVVGYSRDIRVAIWPRSSITFSMTSLYICGICGTIGM